MVGVSSAKGLAAFDWINVEATWIIVEFRWVSRVVGPIYFVGTREGRRELDGADNEVDRELAAVGDGKIGKHAEGLD